MARLIRVAVLLSLLLVPAIPLPVQARGECQSLLPFGEYEGTTSVVMDIRAYEGDMLLQQFTYNDTGQLALSVDCTVTGGTYHWDVYRTFSFFPGHFSECAYSVDLSQASGSVVTGAGGLPRIDVRWGQGVISPGECIDAGPAPPATWQFSLDAPPAGQSIGGDFRIIYDDPGGMDYDQVAQMFREQAFVVTLTKSWTLSREARPTVEGFSATLRQFFLQGIPVTNRYTATIDWDGSPPGVARFILEGEPPQNMTVNGNTAYYDLPLGPIQRTGEIPISIEAELNGHVDRRDNAGSLILVPLPAWANPFNFQAHPQVSTVLYRGEYRLPSQPLDAHVTLPSAMPYIGGTWGLLPTQIRVPLAANSSGARESSRLAAMGGFGLGRRTFALNSSGNVHGTLTRDALHFESDQLALSTSGIFFREHAGLLTVVPGASAFFSVPVIGDLLQSLNSALGVTADVRGSMTGRGRLGVTGDTLALTQGAFDATLSASATAGIDTLVAWAAVSGGGNGSLSMEFVPATRLISCEVLLWFRAGAGAFGFTVGPLNAEFPLYNCQTASGESIVVSSREVITTYGSPALIGGERAVTQEALIGGLSESVLVTGASLQARPVLVAGPDGLLAVTWNSVGNKGAADAVSVRFFDGDTWGDALVLSEEAKPAFGPTAAFAANGNLLVAWAEAQSAPSPEGLTADFARSFEIAWAEVEPASGEVAREGRVTTDTVLDFAPRLEAAQDGSVWLGWLNSPGATVAGSQGAPNQIVTTRWMGSGWGAPETAAQNLVGTLSWDFVAVDSDQLLVVADVDGDGDLSGAADRELYVYLRAGGGWEAPYRLTSNEVIDSSPLLALTPGGEPVLTWRSGDSVLGVAGDPTSTPPELWFDEGAGVGPMLGNGQLLAGDSGELVIVWPEGTAQGQDIWLSRFNPQAGGWSVPAPLFRTDEQRRAPSAILLPGGDILVSTTAAPVTMETITVSGGGTTTVPSVSESARVLVARIPAGFVPGVAEGTLFLPVVRR